MRNLTLTIHFLTFLSLLFPPPNMKIPLLLKISNEHHRRFHFCRAVLSTHSFFKLYFQIFLSYSLQKILYLTSVGKNFVCSTNAGSAFIDQINYKMQTLQYTYLFICLKICFPISKTIRLVLLMIFYYYIF
jgi:hypothetical protein